MKSEIVESRRLLLRTMTPPVLEALLAGDRATAARLLACHIAADVPLDDMPLARRLSQLRNDPSEEPWLLRAMITRDTQQLIGHIGFHTPPRPTYLAAVVADGVELGYSVQEPFRRQRFATEALLALMQWAFTTHEQRCFVLSISPQNVPSTKMAERLGFTPCSSHIDDEDGLEIVYSLRLSEWPHDWGVCIGTA